MPQCHLLTLIRRVVAMAIEGETGNAKTCGGKMEEKSAFVYVHTHGTAREP